MSQNGKCPQSNIYEAAKNKNKIQIGFVLKVAPGVIQKFHNNFEQPIGNSAKIGQLAKNQPIGTYCHWLKLASRLISQLVEIGQSAKISQLAKISKSAKISQSAKIGQLAKI